MICAAPISNAVPISVVTQIELVGEQLTATMRATEGGLDGQAVIEGPLDTLPTAPFLVYPLTTPLQGRANLRGEIGPVVELFLPPRTDVAGQIDTDLEFTVPTTPTGLAGRIALTEGRFEQGVLGLNLKNITMIAELSGETFNVPTLSAEGGERRHTQRIGAHGSGRRAPGPWIFRPKNCGSSTAAKAMPKSAASSPCPARRSCSAWRETSASPMPISILRDCPSRACRR